MSGAAVAGILAGGAAVAGGVAVAAGGGEGSQGQPPATSPPVPRTSEPFSGATEIVSCPPFGVCYVPDNPPPFTVSQSGPVDGTAQLTPTGCSVNLYVCVVGTLCAQGGLRIQGLATNGPVASFSGTLNPGQYAIRLGLFAFDCAYRGVISFAGTVTHP